MTDWGEITVGTNLKAPLRAGHAGLETEVHQLRNLPLAPEESAGREDSDVDFEDELARERGGKGAGP